MELFKGVFRKLIILVHILMIAANDLYTERDEDLNYENDISDDDTTFMKDERQLEFLKKLLVNILSTPWPDNVIPVVYVEDPSIDEKAPEALTYNDEFRTIHKKRTRYYRRYPWKRQNTRYEATNRYLCQPSKDDLFRLLVTLHSSRQALKGQTIDFCNRKRPATSVFTNIRFVG